MNIPILIPSRGRSWTTKTLLQMPHELWHRVHLAVPKEELSQYHDRWSKSVAHIFQVSDYGTPIGVKRHNAVNYLTGYVGDFTHFWMMDDDLSFFRRRAPDDTRLVQLDSPEEWAAMLGTAEAMASSEPDRWSTIGISIRQGNNNLKEDVVLNTRVIRAGLFNLEAFLACDHNRVPYKADIDVQVQMLRMGYDNCVLSKWAQEHGATNAPGGCKDAGRDEELMAASSYKLAEFHPGIVVPKVKQNKRGPVKEQVDVTVYWKKARKQADL